MKASGKAQKRKANTRPVRGPVKQKSNMRMQRGDIREIPTVVANIVRGVQPRQAVAALQGKEIMGFIRISPGSQSGLSGQQLMNPLTLACERLRKFVSIYGQYKFTRMEFTVHGNLPTTVGGNLYLGYSRNPDFTITTGADAPSFISSMENSMAVSVWSTSTFSPRVMTNEWYNVDDDSSEVMKTTQGILFIATGGIYNITQDVEIPVYLNYVVEARGQQVQTTGSSPILIYPSGTFDLSSSSTWGNSRPPSETLAYPVMELDAPYFLSPQLTVPAGDGSTSETANVIVIASEPVPNPPDSSVNVTFYKSFEDYNTNTPIKVINPDPEPKIVHGRFTVEAIDTQVRSLYNSLAGVPQPVVSKPLFATSRTNRSAVRPNYNLWI